MQRPYQEEAVHAVYEHLQNREDNPCVVLPTGSGKSIVIAQICSDTVLRWNGRLLILAHVKELLQQNAGKLHRPAQYAEQSVGLITARTFNDTGRLMLLMSKKIVVEVVKHLSYNVPSVI